MIFSLCKMDNLIKFMIELLNQESQPELINRYHSSEGIYNNGIIKMP